MAHYYFENMPHGKRKDGSKLNTRMHYEYVCRDGKYLHIAGREEDLVYSSNGNMPAWASSPSDFWNEAELHRRKNGRAYREFRFALQEEFTLAENIELVERLMSDFGIKENHAYSYAIHDKEATFDKEHRNIHCHLMFNEKIIEKDRSLPADMFFKQYASDRNGNPTSGYRTSNYFDRKETTLSLRQRWAELCNERFAEKGLSCRISEKTLSRQKEALLAEGRNDEAALFDRVPAPHLGASYRNPHTMEQIMAEAELAENLADEYADKHEEDFGEISPQEWDELPLPDMLKAICQSENTMRDNQDLDEDFPDNLEDTGNIIKERNILLFANDLAIRRVARQIQQERTRLAKLQKERDDEEKAQEILSDPMIITAGDVMDFMHGKQQELQEKSKVKLDEYRQMKSTFIDDKKLHLIAVDRAFDGQYLPACAAYAKLSKQMEELKPKLESLYGDTERVHELAQLSREYQEIMERRKEHGKQIGIFRNQMNGAFKEKIATIERQLSDENADMQREANRHYGEYKNLQKRIEEYGTVLQRIEEVDKDMVLFSERLPRELTRFCKIDGTLPVGKCRTLVRDGFSYALLDRLQPSENWTQEQPPTLEVFAVRLGDEIHRGNAPKYLLWVSPSKEGKWKIRKVQPVLTKDGKPEMVHLYPVHAKKEKSNVTVSSTSPKVQAAHQMQSQAKILHISRLADSLLKNKKGIRLDAQWSNKTDANDKAMRDEDMLYAGWMR